MSPIKRHFDICHTIFVDIFHDKAPHLLRFYAYERAKDRLIVAGRYIFQQIKKIGAGNRPLPTELKGKFWLSVGTQNNVDSISFLKKAVPDSVYATLTGPSRKEFGVDIFSLEIDSRNQLPYFWLFPFVFLFMLIKKPFKTFRVFDRVVLSFASYGLYKNLLKVLKPKAIVFANDHVPVARALIRAAVDCNIPTIYIQHAPVSEYFPPLIFDLSLLEGKDSEDKYQLERGRVELIGMPKFDDYSRKLNTSKKVERVGIAMCMTIPHETLYPTLNKLAKEFDKITFTIRLHPADSTKLDSARIPEKVTISKGAVFNFLSEQDLIVSGNSGIHLEAALLNVQSVYYDFGVPSPIDDYYGFVKNDLVKRAFTEVDLIQIIKQAQICKTNTTDKVNYYNATIGTEWEGRSEELAIFHINNLLAEKKPIKELTF